MENTNLNKDEKILEEQFKDQKIAKAELSDDDLDKVAGGTDPLELFKTIKDILTK